MHNIQPCTRRYTCSTCSSIRSRINMTLKNVKTLGLFLTFLLVGRVQAKNVSTSVTLQMQFIECFVIYEISS